MILEGKLYKISTAISSAMPEWQNLQHVGTVAQMKQATRTGRTLNAPHSGGSRHGPSRASRRAARERGVAIIGRMSEPDASASAVSS